MTPLDNLRLMLKTSVEARRLFHDELHEPAPLTYLGQEDFVYRNGLAFQNIARRLLPIGAPKSCFKNAAHVALHDDRFTYCEGFALSQGKFPFPALHAWLCDEEGSVHEVTWSKRRNNYDPRSAAYIGVPFDAASASSTPACGFR